MPQVCHVATLSTLVTVCAAVLGDCPDRREVLSLVVHLDAEVCPLFVWATMLDPPGLPSALAWTSAAAEIGASLELHLYPEGWHGLGLTDGGSGRSL